jgi:hypothetical protein
MKATGFLCLLVCFTLHAAPPTEKTVIARTEAAITVDGRLDDAAWQTATKFETWYETNPGDNIEPKVKTVGWVTYDSRFLYFGIESSDPNPSNIIAPYADHDQISGNTDDYVGIIVDTRDDGKTAYLFLVTARGVQYDAVTDDAGAGEDNAPDFFWDSASTINENGWTAEARVPFSSLRYESPNPEQWGLILYRNWPRERRYQMFTNRLPRDSNCFVCNYGKITGLRDLPAGDHMVLAPYMTAQQRGEPRFGPGSDFINHPVGVEAGLDFKWSPSADMAVDATINPDFSQIESDVAVISTNERFAIFLPEKRPFFLEGIELFSTPTRPSTPGRSPRRASAAVPPARRATTPTRSSWPRTVVGDRSSFPRPTVPGSRSRTSRPSPRSAACAATSGGRSSAFWPPPARTTREVTTASSVPISRGGAATITPSRGRCSTA